MIKTILSRLILICSLCMILPDAKAQYISIPDSVFGDFLRNYSNMFPCMSYTSATGWLMDTTCANRNGDTLLTLINHGFTDLTGIQYFKKVQHMVISQEYGLSVMPDLSATKHLKVFDCSDNTLTLIQGLPDSLEQFNCSGNYLTSLPSLPTSLTYLDVSSNPLGVLPSILPPKLYYLGCSYNNLTTIPVLPDSLTDLVCEVNQLTALPVIPSKLIQLDCRQNNLTTIPAVPGSLLYFNCSYNMLSELPRLPRSLSQLYCQHNFNLSCLPNEITYLTWFQFDSTQIHCLPARMLCLVSIPVSVDSFPLCLPNSGCTFAYNISGNLHMMQTDDCYSDSLYNGAAISGLKLQMSNTGQIIKETYSFGHSLGQYSFKTDSASTYTITVDTSFTPFYVVCPSTEERTNTVTVSDSIFLDQDFGLGCKGVDNGVNSIYGRVRLSVPSEILVNAGDMARNYGATCADHSGGTVVITLSGPIDYQAPAPGALNPSSVAGNTLTYNIQDFENVQTGDFNIQVLTNGNATDSSLICVVASVTTNGNVDINPYNDAKAQCFPIDNSHDPNLKSAYPTNTVDTGSRNIDYTINFQNTGNDTAYLVVVKDTLSPDLDPASFRFIGSSHKVLIDINGSAVQFTFPKINLVDSMHNEPLSHGWLQYQIRTKSGLPIGTQVTNTASIYFDLNAAVVTNTTTNTVEPDTAHFHLGVNALNNPYNISVYPNPNKGIFTLATADGEASSYIITDILGNIVMQHSISSAKQKIDMSGVSDGIYVLMVKGEVPVRLTIVK